MNAQTALSTLHSRGTLAKSNSSIESAVYADAPELTSKCTQTDFVDDTALEILPESSAAIGSTDESRHASDHNAPSVEPEFLVAADV